MESSNGDLTSMFETVVGMRGIIFSQTRQIDYCLHLLAKQRDGEESLADGDPEVFRVILTMIHMVGISGHSMLKLTEEVDLGVRDAFPLARGIIEGVINICLIMAEGPDSAAKAARHAEVKAYRDLKREWNVGSRTISLSHTYQLPSTEIARLDAMLPEFTTKKGRERNWTDLTIAQRLDVVSETFPNSALVSLNASTFNIYSHASEIIHGSYFSAGYFWGLTLPGRGAPKDSDEFRLTLANHQFSVLMSTIFAYAGLVECFASYVKFPELLTQTNEHLDRLRKLPSVAGAWND
ncbi:DUF5677 domain-containing protein [Parasphingorhabdus sp.]|uniref:DUF5677 domain-containing protein n=1 Tax=Parasphingorhabdus sp. TaxID=2709688 RepID=UPI003A8D9652